MKFIISVVIEAIAIPPIDAKSLTFISMLFVFVFHLSAWKKAVESMKVSWQ